MTSLDNEKLGPHPKDGYDHVYITTPIYYVNDVPHVGTAYTTVIADALTRFFRIDGSGTYFLTGTDEHGLKIERSAEEKGISPKQFVDDVSQRFREAWPKLNIEPSDFIRTTEERHMSFVQEVWKKVAANGHLTLGEYEDWYCVGCESFKTEKDLLPGNLCPDHKKPVERVKEETYFFALDRFATALNVLYARSDQKTYGHPLEFVLPRTRQNEVTSFLKEELRPLSCSRTSFKWGIPVPGDPKHIMYVWFDALTNYRSALGHGDLARFWPTGSDRGTLQNGGEYQKTRLVHLVGKDILRFHAVYWPAFLLAAKFTKEEVAEKNKNSSWNPERDFDGLPTQIFAHGFLTIDGEKMSKSLRNAVDPLRIAHELGADALRYYLLRAVSFGQDGDFSHADLIERTNADLGKNLGNLLNRVLGLCSKNTDGKVPPCGELSELDRTFLARVDWEFLPEIRRAWRDLEPHYALERTMALSSAANQYIDQAAPWTAAKNGDKARVETILHVLLRALEVLSILMAPALPEKSNAMRTQLGIGILDTSPVKRDESNRDREACVPFPAVPFGTPIDASGSWKLSPAVLPTHQTQLRVGDTLSPGVPLFPTIDKDREKELLEKLQPKVEKMSEETKPADVVAAGAPVAAAPVEAAAPLAPITYDQFAMTDLRVGLVKAAEKVAKKDKLLKLSVDVGEPEPRIIIAGLALTFTPESLVGKRVVVVANLAPRDFGKGLISHGMLLASGPSEALHLATIDENVVPGSKLKYGSIYASQEQLSWRGRGIRDPKCGEDSRRDCGSSVF